MTYDGQGLMSTTLSDLAPAYTVEEIETIEAAPAPEEVHTIEVQS